MIRGTLEWLRSGKGRSVSWERTVGSRTVRVDVGPALGLLGASALRLPGGRERAVAVAAFGLGIELSMRPKDTEAGHVDEHNARFARESSLWLTPRLVAARYQARPMPSEDRRRTFVASWAGLLLGRRCHDQREVSREAAELELAEGVYDLVVKRVDLRTWRSRTPWWKRRTRVVSVLCEKGIAVPTARRCHDGRPAEVFHTRYEQRDVGRQEALQGLLDEVTRQRRTYGGSFWLPVRRVRARAPGPGEAPLQPGEHLWQLRDPRTSFWMDWRRCRREALPPDVTAAPMVFDLDRMLASVMEREPLRPSGPLTEGRVSALLRGLMAEDPPSARRPS